VSKTPKIQTLGNLKHHIAQIVSYNWDDEMEDYQRNPCASHVFLSLKALNNWLNEE
jgi:hypothetical protein